MDDNLLSGQANQRGVIGTLGGKILLPPRYQTIVVRRFIASGKRGPVSSGQNGLEENASNS